MVFSKEQNYRNIEPLSVCQGLWIRVSECKEAAKRESQGNSEFSISVEWWLQKSMPVLQI